MVMMIKMLVMVMTMVMIILQMIMTLLLCWSLKPVTIDQVP